MRSAAENIRGVFVARVSVLALSVLTAFFYAAVLEPWELAMIAWVSILSGLDEIFGGLGTAGFLLRAYPRAVAERNHLLADSYVRTFALVSVSSTMFVTIVTAMLSGPIFEALFGVSVEPTIRYLIIGGTFLAGLDRTMSFVAQARTAFVPLSIVVTSKQIFRSVAVISLYFLFGAHGLVLGIVLSELGSFLALLYIVRDGLFVKTSSYPLLKMLSASIGYYVEGYVRYITVRSDTLLVSVLFGPAELAYYFMARNLADKVVAFRDGISQVMVPYLARASAMGAADFQRVVNRCVGAFSVVLLPAAVMLCSGSYWLLDLFSSGRYIASTWSTVLLTVNLTLTAYMAVFSQAVYVRGAQTERLRILLVQSVGMMGGLLAISLVWQNYNIVAASRLCGTIPALAYGHHRLMSVDRFRLSSGATAAMLKAGLAASVVAVGGQLFYYSLWAGPIWLAAGAAVGVMAFANLSEKSEVEALLMGTPPFLVTALAAMYRVCRWERPWRKAGNG